MNEHKCPIIKPGPVTQFGFMESDSLCLFRCLLDGETIESAQRHKTLQKYTIPQLEEQASKLLKNPPLDLLAHGQDDPTPPFTDEEDMYVLAFLQLHEKGMTEDEFFTEFGYHFPIRRTRLEFKERLEHMKNASEGDVKDLIARCATKIIDEQSGYFRTVLPPDIDASLESLEQSMKYISAGAFKHDSLGMFVNENVSYYMCARRVVIGVGSQAHAVTVDLRFFDERVPVKHLERVEIELVFEEDGKFYALNSGCSEFRINGTIIERGKCTRVPNYAVFDIENVLFVFLINEEKVSNIMAQLEKKMLELS